MSEDTEAQRAKFEIVAPFLENAEPGLSVGGFLRDRPVQRLLRKLNSIGMIRKTAILSLAIGVSVVGLQQYVGMEQRAGLGEDADVAYMAVLEANYSGMKKLKEYRSGFAVQPGTKAEEEQFLEDVGSYYHEHDGPDPAITETLAALSNDGAGSRSDIAAWFTENGIDMPIIQEALGRHGVRFDKQRGEYLVDPSMTETEMAPSLSDLQQTITMVASQTGGTLPQAAAMLGEAVEGLMIKTDLCHTGAKEFCLEDQIVFQGDANALVLLNATSGMMWSPPISDWQPVDGDITVDKDDFGPEGEDLRERQTAGIFSLGAASGGPIQLSMVDQNDGSIQVVVGQSDAPIEEIIEEITGGLGR